VVEYAVALSRSQLIEEEELPQVIFQDRLDRLQQVEAVNGIHIPAGTSLEDAERLLILHTLEENGGHRRKTAHTLGISERGLRHKLKQYCEEEK